MSFFRYFTAWTDIRRSWADRDQPEALRKLTHMVWRALLGLSAILMSASIGWGAWMLMSVMDTSDSGVIVTGGGGAALNKEQLQKTLDGFEARRTRYDSLKNGNERFVDPSR